VHTVVRYNYTMEGSRDHMLTFLQKEKTVSFERVFEECQDKIHAIFLFLSILELTQQKYMKLMIGDGRNNFIVEWNENREEDLLDAGLTEEDLTIREDDPIIID
jgi:segregation and condensation protein A